MVLSLIHFRNQDRSGGQELIPPLEMSIAILWLLNSKRLSRQYDDNTHVYLSVYIRDRNNICNVTKNAGREARDELGSSLLLSAPPE